MTNQIRKSLPSTKNPHLIMMKLQPWNFIPPPNGADDFNENCGQTFDYEKECVLVGKIDLESMQDESSFGAATEMGGYLLEKGLELSLTTENVWTSILTSSELLGADSK